MLAGDKDRIRDALGHVPAHDRDTWLRMGMAVKSALGEAGFDLWDAWSRQAESYQAAAARAAWRSFKVNGKVTVGTLFYEAKANGWRDDGTCRAPSPEEIARCKQKAAARTAAEMAENAKARAKAKSRAAAMLDAAAAARPDHPYLVGKGVAPVPTLREMPIDVIQRMLGYVPRSQGRPLTGRVLLVPIEVGGELSTVEMIDAVGLKAALAGRGTKNGGHWAAEPLPAGDGTGLTILVGEGVATMLSAREATGHLVVAAFANTNLGKVAVALRERFAAASIVVLADLNKSTGLPDRHAIVAAHACAGRLAVPDFGADRPTGKKDFNDLAALRGNYVVARAIAQAHEVAGDAMQADDGTCDKPTVQLVRASDITPQPVRWLWRGYLPQAKLTILGGAAGTGKTTLAMSIAATITKGGSWPDGSRSPVGDVVIWSGEDGANDTLAPRLIVAGADLHRVHFVDDVQHAGQRRPFDPAKDLEHLRLELAKIGNVRLVIVDSIVSAVSGDSHKNAEVRRSLQPLVTLADETGCAILGITHFTKGTAGREPLERITGSLAFGALARVVIVAAKPQEDKTGVQPPRLFIRAKSNLGPDGGGFEYELPERQPEELPHITATVVKWGKPIKGTARKLLADAEANPDDGRRSELAEAKKFLTELLANGPLDAKKVKADAAGMELSHGTLRRAQKALGIKPRKDGMDGGWLWELPRRCSTEPEGAQQPEMSTFEEFEHLREDDDLVEVDV